MSQRTRSSASPFERYTQRNSATAHTDRSEAMSFDISKYAADVVNSTSKSIDRDFIGEGDHVVKIESVIGMTSQNTGNDLVIIEGEILATKNSEHSKGDKVKQIFTLSGVPSWKVKETVGILKSIVTACLPTGTEVTEEMVSKALTGGAESLLVGDAVRVMARTKTSKKGATYLSFSYDSVPEEIAQDPNKPYVAGPYTPSETTDVNDDDMPF